MVSVMSVPSLVAVAVFQVEFDGIFIANDKNIKPKANPALVITGTNARLINFVIDILSITFPPGSFHSKKYESAKRGENIAYIQI